MDPDAIFSLLRHGPAERRQHFASTLPPTPFTAMGAPLLAAEDPAVAIVGLGPSITHYCAGAAPEIGAPLALAAHRCAVELFETSDHHGLLPNTLAALASAYVNAANLLGRSDDVLEFTGRYVPFYERIGELENLTSLKLARVQALLNLNRLDDAAQALADPHLLGNPSTDIEVQRLRRRLEQLRASITIERLPAQTESPAESIDATVKMLRGMLDQLEPTLPPGTDIEGVLRSIEGMRDVDTEHAAGFSRLLDTLGSGEAFLSGDSDAESELTLRRRIREASGLFVTEQRPAPERIRASLAELEDCRDRARAHGFAELEQDALYGIYLCHSRLDDPSLAADALLELRGRLETLRSGIADPLRRGGAFSTYPHLFPALCEKLYSAGRMAELLEAIEASKGRGVADLLTTRAGRAIADASIYGAAARLPSLCTRHDFHYATWFVDDERSYAVIVTKDGRIHAPPPVPLTRATIRDAALHVDPRHWGEPSDYDFDVTLPDASETLSPLLSGLEPLFADGSIETGDHLCIAADDDMANVPFAYLRVDGRLLADLLTTSRIHNAQHLEHALGEGEVATPAAYVAVVAPTRQNLERDSWERMRAHLLQPLETLAARLPGQTLSDLGANVASLGNHALRQRVVHFSTHGIFPRHSTDRTPFEHSGLVLSDGEALADEDSIAAGELEAVLTPRAVLDAGLDLSGSHVSMMACVSGLSREGIGGDALGMEWAMIQAGAASVLSSHWYVSAELASAFLCAFYSRWPRVGESRRQALSTTIDAMRAAGGRTAEPACWAAFSLTGDWR